MRVRLFVPIVCLLFFVEAPTHCDDEVIPVFKIETEMVRLHLTVLDEENRPVEELKKGNVVIIEDDEVQATSFFYRDEVPLGITLLVDISGSMAKKIALQKSALLYFVIELLNINDTARIVSFDSGLNTVQDDTGNPGLLVVALSSLREGSATALYGAIDTMCKQENERYNSDPDKRRVIVLFTDGMDTSTEEAFDGALAAARSTNAVMYAIVMLEAFQLKPESLVKTMKKITPLENIVAQTGGRTFIISINEKNDIDSQLEGILEVYDELANEIRTLYTVGYVSSNKRKNGAWRSIKVRIIGGSGYEVRHRRGYFAPKN